ncbi:hypothetical protein VP01_1301g4 [Puccinia sorghi]|uniref:Uncharacterized protein n=1 Tax=Puccinia sorghi TaxID=27349 RepID=A0A0L6VPU5_9BASI|nr:hypothetical protein VP01_1301g4 [Puccinia sorghi]
MKLDLHIRFYLFPMNTPTGLMWLQFKRFDQERKAGQYHFPVCKEFSRCQSSGWNCRAWVINEEEEFLMSDDDEEDWINIKMKLLYSTHPLNSSYNQKLPVYVNPAGPRQYILLKMANCQEWAKSLVSSFSTIFYQ